MSRLHYFTAVFCATLVRLHFSMCMYVLLVLHFHHAASSIENSVESTVP